MVKETVVCIVIVIVIIVGNIFTQNYSKSVVADINKKLEELKPDMEQMASQEDETGNSEDIDTAKYENVKTKVKEIKEDWTNKQRKLAYYIEHDELEKVKNNMVSLQTNIDMKDFVTAMDKLEENKFVLEHIQEKYAFNLENIF